MKDHKMLSSTKFMASVISNQGGFYTTFAYLSEAKRLGIRVLLPDINRSTFPFRAEDDETPVGDRKIPPDGAHPPQWRAIRVGSMQIKGVNKKTTQAVLKERDQEGPFRSLQDLLERAAVPEADGTLLVKSGALDCLEPKMSRSQIMWISWSLSPLRIRRPSLRPTSSPRPSAAMPT